MAHSQQTPRLGRGLDAIFGPRNTADEQKAPDRSALRTIAIGQIRPNPFQPRKEFKPEDLADLESSLKSSGLLQPITVRAAPGGAGFELIAGERRLRAAQRIGWTEIQAVVREADDRALLSMALVENLQRADLNPIEEAEGYQRLINDFDLTQQQVADAVGKDRSTVANILRLLVLPASVKRLVWEGAISLGHARALLSLGDEAQISAMARQIIAEGLSVRDVERQARTHAGAGKRKASAAKPPSTGNAEIRRAEELLRKKLQTNASILVSGGKGEIRIPFYSPDDLERTLDLIVGPDREYM
ncbi:MAG TPA: ParB/RepB/Spo0J family partition protein [Gemmatimonadaceae bacterium]|nr:ParB/RepB/Spo0J family partition protein [Gemmatimonadaceae bacterium]